MGWENESLLTESGPGYMIKMAAIFIYGKDPSKFSSPEPKYQ